MIPTGQVLDVDPITGEGVFRPASEDEIGEAAPPEEGTPRSEGEAPAPGEAPPEVDEIPPEAMVREFSDLTTELEVAPEVANALVAWYEQVGHREESFEAQAEGFTEEARRHGLSDRQIKEIIAWGAEIGEQQAVLGELRTEWREDFASRLAEARAAARELGKEGQALLDETGLGNDPRFIRALARLGQRLTDAASEEGRPLTPAAAQARIKRLMGDRRGPYWDASHPAHSATVAEVRRLFEIVHGGASA